MQYENNSKSCIDSFLFSFYRSIHTSPQALGILGNFLVDVEEMWIEFKKRTVLPFLIQTLQQIITQEEIPRDSVDFIKAILFILSQLVQTVETNPHESTKNEWMKQIADQLFIVYPILCKLLSIHNHDVSYDAIHCIYFLFQFLNPSQIRVCRFFLFLSFLHRFTVIIS